MLNQTVIVGRLVKDPELKETDNGAKVTNITLAVPRSFKNSEGEYETDFISCVLWKGIAENTVEYCQKGDLLGVKGRVQTRNYEDKDGKKVYVTEVVADTVQFLDSKKSGDNVTPQDFNNQTSQSQSDPYADFGDSIEISDDDLPF